MSGGGAGNNGGEKVSVVVVGGDDGGEAFGNVSSLKATVVADATGGGGDAYGSVDSEKMRLMGKLDTASNARTAVAAGERAARRAALGARRGHLALAVGELLWLLFVLALPIGRSPTEQRVFLGGTLDHLETPMTVGAETRHAIFSIVLTGVLYGFVPCLVLWATAANVVLGSARSNRGYASNHRKPPGTVIPIVLPAVALYATVLLVPSVTATGQHTTGSPVYSIGTATVSPWLWANLFVPTIFLLSRRLLRQD